MLSGRHVGGVISKGGECYGSLSSWWSSSSRSSWSSDASAAADRFQNVIMMCSRPFRVGVMEHGCGQCLPCRINRRRLWAARLMLEVRKHRASIFVTLTYCDEELPYGETLVPEHCQLFLKRVRHHAKFPVRFYACGEYGETNGRPHYHLVLCGADHAALIKACEASWEAGLSKDRSSLSKLLDIRPMSWELAWYIMGYLCKRYTKHGGPEAEAWLRGRHPEFARMSLRPGIGAVAANDIAEALNSEELARAIAVVGDIPGMMKLHGKTVPFGRYLGSKVREAAGYGLSVPEAVTLKRAAEMYVELGVPGGKERREAKRVNDARSAFSRDRIAFTKRGRV